jgi:hypothetical protein
MNGSFEGGFSDWTSVGPNSTPSLVDGESPTDGSLMAFLSNGRGALSVGIQDFILSSSIGAPAGSIASLFPGSTEGGIAFQTFTLGAGQTAISFDWNFLTNEFTPDGTFNDFGFASIWDGTGSLVSAVSLDTFSSFPGGGSTYSSHTGWLTHTFGSLTAGGSYSLVFGVFDRGDMNINSALLVDNIAAVPEPTGLVMIACIAGVAGVTTRRRK